MPASTMTVPPTVLSALVSVSVPVPTLVILPVPEIGPEIVLLSVPLLRSRVATILIGRATVMPVPRNSNPPDVADPTSRATSLAGWPVGRLAEAGVGRDAEEAVE